MDKEEQLTLTYQEGGNFVVKDYNEKYMRFYKQEEINLMNYILGKPENNYVFTPFELELLSDKDLLNKSKKCIDLFKTIYKKEVLDNK